MDYFFPEADLVVEIMGALLFTVLCEKMNGQNDQQTNQIISNLTH